MSKCEVRQKCMKYLVILFIKIFKAKCLLLLLGKKEINSKIHIRPKIEYVFNV